MAFNLDTLLHDLIVFATIAASIFIKNPNSQVHAAQLLGVANQLLPLIDPQTGKPIPTA